jgi:hypothetical protein
MTLPTERLPKIKPIVHISWEALYSLGGGSVVLKNILTSPSYLSAGYRTILVSPLFLPVDSEDFTRREDPHKTIEREGEILYSSLYGIEQSYGTLLKPIEDKYNVSILYGTRKLLHNEEETVEIEVLLVDLSDNIDCSCIYMQTLPQFIARLNTNLKTDLETVSVSSHGWLYKWFSRLCMKLLKVRFGGSFFVRWLQQKGLELDVLKYAHIDDDYLFGMMLAEPAFDAIDAITGSSQCIMMAQEYFSLPALYKARLDGGKRFRLVYYSGEVRPVKTMIEYGDGRACFNSEFRFYSLMRVGLAEGQSMSDMFDVASHSNFKLIRQAHLCDTVGAISHSVAEELKFLNPEFQQKDIHVAPHGNNFISTSLKDKLDASSRLKAYIEKEIGFVPDHILTRISRPDVCKTLHRDIFLCEKLAERLQPDNRKFVLIVVTTWNIRNIPNTIVRLLSQVDHFNETQKHSKILLFNQFDWPLGTQLSREDLLRATDCILGQASYESFGLAQLEPLSCGAICVISGVSGARYCLEDICQKEGTVLGDYPNIILADYSLFPNASDLTIEQIKQLTELEQFSYEHKVAEKISAQLNSRLPHDSKLREMLIESGAYLSKKMLWDEIIRTKFLPMLGSLD